jgi:hypothetical protein
MKYTVEMASAGMIYVPSFMTISSGIQIILLPQELEGQQHWYYWEGIYKVYR